MSKGKNERRRGRPPLPPESGKRYPLGVRTTQAMRDRLVAAAKKSGRSIAQETEVALERFYGIDDEARTALEMAYGRRLAALLVLVGRVMGQVGRTTRSLAVDHRPEARDSWFSDPCAYDQAVEVARQVLEGYRPPGDPGTHDALSKGHAHLVQGVLRSLHDDGGAKAELEYVYERLGKPTNLREGEK